MYLPSLYHVTDEAEIKRFVDAHDFATLVSSVDGAPFATHLLLETERAEAGRWTLTGHLARANPQWRSLDPEREVLAIFGGPHTYVSPRWYNHINVPTWNYQAVHVYGRPRLMTDEAELYAHLRRMVDRYEAGSGADPVYRLEALPRDFVERQMRAIVGFQIQVTRLEAKYKLSQNREAGDFDRVAAELERRPDEASHQVASAMRQHRPARFTGQ